MTKSEFASKVAELVDGKLDSFVVETPHKGITMKVYAFKNGPHPVDQMGYQINWEGCSEIVYPRS